MHQKQKVEMDAGLKYFSVTKRIANKMTKAKLCLGDRPTPVPSLQYIESIHGITFLYVMKQDKNGLMSRIRHE